MSSAHHNSEIEQYMVLETPFYSGLICFKFRYDIQLLYAFKFTETSDKYLKGLGKVQEKCPMSFTERMQMERAKEAGLRLFAREHGGTSTVWERRPLPQDLIEYAACDVKFLLKMKQTWGGTRYDRTVIHTTAERARTMVDARIPVTGREKAKRDFNFQGFGVTPTPRYRGRYDEIDDFDDYLPDHDDIYRRDDYDDRDEYVDGGFWDAHDPEDFGFDSIFEAEMAGF